MNDSECLKLISLFIAGLKHELDLNKQNNLLLLKPHAFVHALIQQSKNNIFTSRYHIYQTLAGQFCPDFQRGITIAQSAGYIYLISPSYDHFIINMTSRQVNNFSKDILFENALSIARTYLKFIGFAGVKQ